MWGGQGNSQGAVECETQSSLWGGPAKWGPGWGQRQSWDGRPKREATWASEGRTQAGEGNTAGGGAEGRNSAQGWGWNHLHLLACNTFRIKWYSIRCPIQIQKCKLSRSFLISPPRAGCGLQSFGCLAGWQAGAEELRAGGGTKYVPVRPVGISLSVGAKPGAGAVPPPAKARAAEDGFFHPPSPPQARTFLFPPPPSHRGPNRCRGRRGPEVPRLALKSQENCPRLRGQFHKKIPAPKHPHPKSVPALLRVPGEHSSHLSPTKRYLRFLSARPRGPGSRATSLRTGGRSACRLPRRTQAQAVDWGGGYQRPWDLGEPKPVRPGIKNFCIGGGV